MESDADTPLAGHTTPLTAHVVHAYPFGQNRCLMRVWVETAEKGAKKGRQRMVTQTTARPFNYAYTERLEKEGPAAAAAWAAEHPCMTTAGAPWWNKPHAGTYHGAVGLYLTDMGDGTGRRRVEHAVLSEVNATPKQVEDFRAFFAPVMTPDLDDAIKRSEATSRRYNRGMWLKTVTRTEPVELDDGTAAVKHHLSDGRTVVMEYAGTFEVQEKVGPGVRLLGTHPSLEAAIAAA